MRILVDARHVESGGIGRFLRGIVGPLLGGGDHGGVGEGAEGNGDVGNVRDVPAGRTVEEVRLLGPAEPLRGWLADVAPGAETGGRATIVPWSDPMYSVRAQLRWALRLRSAFNGCDVAFFPHYDVPLLRHPSPSIVTVHDLTQFLLPEHFPRRKRWAGRRLLRGAVRRAERVLTVSEHSRADLVRHLGVDRDRIAVVPDGVDGVFRPLSEAERERAAGRWGSLRPYLLLVGPDRPHKNHAFAVEVLSASDPQLRLVRVGPPDPGPGAARARQAGLDDRLVPLGRVDDEELRELYGLAEALLFPSVAEGFGLPPLEAAACGTPALAGPDAVVEEIARAAGVTILPLDDVDAWVAALTKGPRPEAGPSEPADGVVGGARPASLPRWEDASRCVLAELLAVAAPGPSGASPGISRAEAPV